MEMNQSVGGLISSTNSHDSSNINTSINSGGSGGRSSGGGIR